MEKKIIGIIIILIFTCLAASAEVTDLERLSRIEGHLESIRIDYEFQRAVSGGIFLSIGAASSLIGIYFLLPNSIGFSSYGYHELDIIFGSVFLGTGIIYGTVGGIVLIFPSENETLPKAFGKMPELTEDEIKAKIIRGEVYLESLSRKARNGRYLSSGISLIAGIGMVAYSMMLKDSEGYYDSDTYYDPMIYTGITSAGLSLVTLFFKTKPEIEYESYEHWKKNADIALDTEHHMNIDIVLLKGGIGLSFKY